MRKLHSLFLRFWCRKERRLLKKQLNQLNQLLALHKAWEEDTSP